MEQIPSSEASSPSASQEIVYKHNVFHTRALNC